MNLGDLADKLQLKLKEGQSSDSFLKELRKDHSSFVAKQLGVAEARLDKLQLKWKVKMQTDALEQDDLANYRLKLQHVPDIQIGVPPVRS